MSIICASIMCADQMKLKEELEALEEAGVKLLHCDVMDGIFVKNLAMGPELLKSISENTTIPLDIHLATETPDKYIDMMSYIKPKYISFHVESSTNVKADIQKLRNYGIGPVLAISPQTSVDKIEEYISLVEGILVMTVNPGFAGQKFNLSVLDKLDKLTEILKDYDNPPFIEVDGNINKDTIKLMNGKKVDIYVVGTSALFNDKPPISYKDKIEELKESIK
ncbi:TPA: ribulose-phosphate 3-epimerase [Clostridioides difficile]|uniref:Ribulose-phosphate 3-epimerase n=8 Tax=Clostridioides difficile TaxID=1496 RepID=Q185J4_CLOD6|nr:ribulose-phosphate 3-epimerase [Clostridioides difficile]EQG60040.1 ribulose-phosphate 3 epimerase family protein [Clostridioides difficile DA00149]EQG75490.1 ribulose-phosphate 3 epimerase family protein [Clostridioides difficile DA00165]EQI34488.1 ribulose-phosphate 3 epimerase family protein [Clostridioides difficile Y184]OFU01761.1 ribulose phosphate epimerase [Clostridium sp. HMSC19E03]OFU02192.1 ribulose phosphate epimerase [Clostridium sp. HMSC19D07]OFU12031.1 ribulose phosphate epi